MKAYLFYIGVTYDELFVNLNPGDFWAVYNFDQTTKVDTFFLTFKR